MDSEKYIGLDVHQATIVVAVLDSSGKLVMESILETKAVSTLGRVEPQSSIRSTAGNRIPIPGVLLLTFDVPPRHARRRLPPMLTSGYVRFTLLPHVKL
jgi:hypothetical protein